ncbi:MAG: hypothetical protein ABIQ60_06720 [Burkholderiaceae bacterium]
MNLAGWIARVLRALLLTLAAIWLFLEEWGWRPLARWLGRLARWPPWARTEAWVARLPPRAALLVFLVPVALLLPVKVLALWLLHAGHTALGVAAILAAKLVGTAIGGRLFVLTEPQLMQVRGFAMTLNWWRDMRERVKSALAASRTWRVVRAGLRRWRSRWRASAR